MNISINDWPSPPKNKTNTKTKQNKQIHKTKQFPIKNIVMFSFQKMIVHVKEISYWQMKYILVYIFPVNMCIMKA